MVNINADRLNRQYCVVRSWDLYSRQLAVISCCSLFEVGSNLAANLYPRQVTGGAVLSASTQKSATCTY